MTNEQLNELERLEKAATPLDVINNLRAKNQELRKAIFNAAGDDLCWIKDDTDAGKIPPKAEFLESCARFHAQIALEKGELTGCKTIAQLERENATLRAELEKAKQDTERMDAIEQWAASGVVTIGLELDGGVFVDVALVGYDEQSYREQNDVRSGMDAARAKGTT